MDTSHRRLFREFLIFFEDGGAAAMKAAPSLKKEAELSGIIMEINDLRRVAHVPDRPKQDRRWFCNRAFRR
jgi:hypothetical protein